MTKVVFNIPGIISGLGLNEGGDVHRFFNLELIKASDKHVPMQDGYLKNSAKVEPDNLGISYTGAQARMLYFGFIMVDPLTGRAGFLTDDGWKSRRGTGYKVPAWQSTIRQGSGLPMHFDFSGSPTRGSFWVHRAWELNKDQIINAVQAYMSKGS